MVNAAIEINEITTSIAPAMVTIDPENSLPRSIPVPSPKIIPIMVPFLSIFFTSDLIRADIMVINFISLFFYYSSFFF